MTKQNTKPCTSRTSRNSLVFCQPPPRSFCVAGANSLQTTESNAQPAAGVKTGRGTPVDLDLKLRQLGSPSRRDLRFRPVHELQVDESRSELAGTISPVTQGQTSSFKTRNRHVGACVISEVHEGKNSTQNTQ